MLGKILLRVFRKQILESYYSERSKSKGFESMEYVFTDSNGKRYFKNSRDLDMPIKRFREVQKMIMLIKAGLSEDSVPLILSNMKDALNSGKKSDISRIGFLVEELSLRVNIWIDPDTLFKTAALMYIREDENPTDIDLSIHKQKVEQFKIDSTGGRYDFFTSAGITAYIPFLGITESEFEDYLMESEIKMKALQMNLEKYTTAA